MSLCMLVRSNVKDLLGKDTLLSLAVWQLVIELFLINIWNWQLQIATWQCEKFRLFLSFWNNIYIYVLFEQSFRCFALCETMLQEEVYFTAIKNLICLFSLALSSLFTLNFTFPSITDFLDKQIPSSEFYLLHLA